MAHKNTLQVPYNKQLVPLQVSRLFLFCGLTIKPRRFPSNSLARAPSTIKLRQRVPTPDSFFEMISEAQ
ncbi:hypothetical protein H4Q26_001633 [Puccinia striiformis f. sp. tritici PST-130]|nr:hypothetical protein H4Q26_001633 [Puccinia striiformis f. sp. tritici PST-130]